jgi:hypothetical protein
MPQLVVEDVPFRLSFLRRSIRNNPLSLATPSGWVAYGHQGHRMVATVVIEFPVVVRFLLVRNDQVKLLRRTP